MKSEVYFFIRGPTRETEPALYSTMTRVEDCIIYSLFRIKQFFSWNIEAEWKWFHVFVFLIKIRKQC